MATNRQVVDAFIVGERASAGNLRSTGEELQSYDYALAWHKGDAIVVNNARTGLRIWDINGASRDAAFSATTKRHRNMVRVAASVAGYEVIERD